VTDGRYLPHDWTLPLLDDTNREFFTAGRLRIQRCTRCGAVQHPPDEICHRCQGFTFGYVDARPTGVVESFTVVHHALHPMLEQRVPYNVVVVALDEFPDVHVVGNVVDVRNEELHVGLRVTCTHVETDGPDGERVRLPQWRASS
jgi:uncharacterized OB-fold protein